jgi:hypothetical protein
VEDDQTGDESSYSASPWTPHGNPLSDSEKTKALADNPENQFQEVTDPSVPANSEMFDVGLRSYFLSLASEAKLTNPDEVQKAIRSLIFGKGPGPIGTPNRALKHLSGQVVSFLP